MARSRFFRVALIGGVLIVIAILIYLFGLDRDRPQQPTSDYDPASFVEKAPAAATAPYVSSEYDIVRAMLNIANVGPNDYVADLGSGDGRIPILAAREKGARGLGVEIDPQLLAQSQTNARNAGVEDRVTFRQEDLFSTRLADVTVLTLFLLPEINLQLRPRILRRMRPGSRVVSNQFDMGDWRPDREQNGSGGTKIYMWIVPAQVAGNWQMTVDGDGVATLRIEQRFQQISGTLNGAAITDARLQGANIRFTVDPGRGQRVFEGTFTDGRLQGQGWQAVRTGG